MSAVPQGFNELYKRNYAAIYRVCYIYMQNQQDAEDCTEDAFLKVINTGMTFNNEDHETEEIAKLVKKPASTVRNLLRDARAKLKTALGGEFNEQ